MKATRGQANAAVVQAAVRERLDAGSSGERSPMGLVNLVLLAAGVILIVVGYTRARGPWARYQALKAQDENVARYESWRGGLRTNRIDRRVGRDADPPPPGPDRRADRDRRGRAGVPRVPHPLIRAGSQPARPPIRRARSRYTDP